MTCWHMEEFEWLLLCYQIDTVQERRFADGGGLRYAKPVHNWLQSLYVVGQTARKFFLSFQRVSNTEPMTIRIFVCVVSVSKTGVRVLSAFSKSRKVNHAAKTDN